MARHIPPIVSGLMFDRSRRLCAASSLKATIFAPARIRASGGFSGVHEPRVELIDVGHGVDAINLGLHDLVDSLLRSKVVDSDAAVLLDNRYSGLLSHRLVRLRRISMVRRLILSSGGPGSADAALLCCAARWSRGGHHLANRGVQGRQEAASQARRPEQSSAAPRYSDHPLRNGELASPIVFRHQRRPQGYLVAVEGAFDAGIDLRHAGEDLRSI